MCIYIYQKVGAPCTYLLFSWSNWRACLRTWCDPRTRAPQWRFDKFDKNLGWIDSTVSTKHYTWSLYSIPVVAIREDRLVILVNLPSLASISYIYPVQVHWTNTKMVPIYRWTAGLNVLQEFRTQIFGAQPSAHFLAQKDLPQLNLQLLAVATKQQTPYNPADQIRLSDQTNPTNHIRTSVSLFQGCLLEAKHMSREH